MNLLLMILILILVAGTHGKLNMSSVSLWEHPDCHKDIEAFKCPLDFKDNNLAIVTCLTNPDHPNRFVGVDEDKEDWIGLSEKCQHVVWQFKIGITNDKQVVKKIREVRKNQIMSIARKVMY